MVGLIPLSLSFSAGVVIYLAMMNLIPEAIELLFHATGEEDEALAHFYALLCVVGGLGLTILLEMLSSKLGLHSHAHPEDAASATETTSSVAMTSAKAAESTPDSGDEDTNAQDMEVAIKDA